MTDAEIMETVRDLRAKGLSDEAIMKKIVPVMIKDYTRGTKKAIKMFKYLHELPAEELDKVESKVEITDSGCLVTISQKETDAETGELITTLRKSRSGLPANVYLDDIGTWTNFGRRKIIKFQPDRGDHAITANMVPMSIDDNPQVLAETPEISLSSHEIEQIKTFVRDNKDLLLQLGEQKIDIGDFIGRMRKRA
ncbi:hypothetical protein FACS189442_6540 [Spirochaetia bacterium]|nr:hypothetical protein FACS189442_6540 [Spirochaetia bacterium]